MSMMGASNSKTNLQVYLNRFNETEQHNLRNVFSVLTNDKEGDKMKPSTVKCFKFNEFQTFVGSSLTPFLTKIIFNGMNSLLMDKQSIRGVCYSSFIYYLTYALKGTYEEQGKIFSKILNNANKDTTIAQIKIALNEIVSTLPQFLNKLPEYQSWNLKNSDSSRERLSKFFFYDLLRKDKEVAKKWDSETDLVNSSDIEDWFSKESLLAKAIYFLINNALPIICEHSTKMNIPHCSGADWTKLNTVIDLPALWLIDRSLPPNLRDTWHLLYSSNIHGESFSTLMGHIAKKGPTVIVIKDKDGFIFGGFASLSWEFKPKFTGTEDCFIFKLSPELRVFESSGFNQNYTYLCLHQHTLPNGLGFGGQMNNFGLWLDADFDHGHSILSCATYRSDMLSGKEQFKVDTVEVWRVGPAQKKADDVAQKSVLDREAAAKTMLTMINRVGASDGLRDIGPENENL